MNPVLAVEKLHRDLLKHYPGNLTVLNVLENQAQTLLEQHRAQNPVVCIQISNWHPKFIGAKQDGILRAAFNQNDAKLTLAREHGFENWAQAEKLGTTRFDHHFENAVNSIVAGEIDKLKELLKRFPQLVHEVSPYGHRATLLHYVAANGVETWRQKVPPNAVEITRLLLEAGADVDAKAEVYGGRFDTLSLLESSAHPATMGLTEPIAALLRAAQRNAAR